MAPSFPIGEPTTMDAPSDWKTQLPFDARPRIVNKIMEALKKHLPFSGPEGVNELRRIASRFEESVFSTASSQTDYLGLISIKMLTMETKSQNAAGSSSTIPAANNGTSMDSEEVPSLPNEEPPMDTGDWRTQLPPDLRQNIVNKIMETLKKHLPFSGPEGTNELRRITARFEEKIFSRAVNQTDYLGLISMKMLTMETKSQNAAGSSSTIPAANNGTSMDSGHPMHNDNWSPPLPNEESAVNTGEWRTQLPPDSRQKNVEKITEALKKHVPVSEEEGLDELMGIADSFEELILNTAENQVDYFRKVSFKIERE